MRPLLDIGYVIVGAATGLFTALLPLVGRLLSFWEAPSNFLMNFNLLIGLICFIMGIIYIYERRITIPCGCAGDMTHKHNACIQTIVAFGIAAIVYGIISLPVSFI